MVPTGSVMAAGTREQAKPDCPTCAGGASGTCRSCSGRAPTISVELGLDEGRPLDGSTRARMEGAFGSDFSGVRLHAGSAGAAASARLNARAFAVGSDIAFGQGEYQPGNPLGDAMLAHELTHVVQHGGGGHDELGAASRPVVANDPGLEAEADGVASSFAVGATQITAPARRSDGLRLHRCVQAGGEITGAAFQFEQVTGGGDPNDRSLPWYAACVNISIVMTGAAPRMHTCQFEVGYPGIHYRGRTGMGEAQTAAADAFNLAVPQLLRARAATCATVSARVQTLMRARIPGVKVNSPCLTKGITETHWPTRH